jgi:phosphoserine phosphatase
VILGELEGRVRALGRARPGALAVFDADGTLWRDDVGEAFLRHLVNLGWVKLPNGKDPYEAYERAVDRDRATGYAYAAQLMAELSVRQVENEAYRFVVEWVPKRVIAATKALRSICDESGLVPFVVSASPLPIVQAAIPLAGIRPENCRAIEVRDQAGRFTDRVVQPITYGPGKLAVAKKTGEIALACGDSLGGDLELLAAAEIAVAVAPARGSPLADEARRRGWPVLSQDS